RQPPNRELRYYEAFRDRPGIYPSSSVIIPGAPLIIVEGQFDSLLLGQELAGLASVITLGSASIRPTGSTHLAMLAAPTWYLAHDADGGGESAAEGWPAHARRVRPPVKDWTLARQVGVDLRRWWEFRLDLAPLPDIASCRWWELLLHLDRFLGRLQARGVHLDGEMAYPHVEVGTVTGRVCYTDPCPQNWPKVDRLARLTPVVPRRRFVRA